MISSPIVVYHANCSDGFCAAWMAWRKFGDSAEYVPAYYGQDPPDVTGKRAYVVDFSYPRPTMLRMLDQAAKCVVLDHHRTAEADLWELIAEPNNSPHLVVFDMNRSGAAMARDFFHPGLDCWLVDYVQDRDLWQWKLPNSKAVSAYISTLPHSFEEWDRVWGTVPLADAIRFGIGAERYKDRAVEKNAQLAIKMPFLGYKDVPVVNCTGDTSEVVGNLAESAPFAVGWFMRSDGKIAYSLRSRGEFDVSTLAKSMGGGGHKNAAGFESSLYPEYLHHKRAVEF